MKGIVLAGGSGTRLYPLTKATSKQLMPLYDKPMIYYSISTLMLADIREILIITTRQDSDNFKKLLGDGSQFGLKLEYAIQDHPNGLAEAFIIGEDFVGSDTVALTLGDNFFYGQHFSKQLQAAKNKVEQKGGGAIFGTLVSDPRAYGVVEFDESQNVLSIEEKPENPKSNYAVPGLYFFDSSVAAKAKLVEPSHRGEIEITSVIDAFLQEKKLSVELLGRGMAWLDTGTHDDLLEAANFVKTVQHRQGLLVGSLEEIGYHNGWLTDDELSKSIVDLQKTKYGQYLNKLLEVK
ncbi:MAG: glucose-1-phosphate thymidylyltransferase RfbA [Mycoplasmatales bacterium]